MLAERRHTISAMSDSVTQRRFESPDELIAFERGNGSAAYVTVGGMRVGREELAPGWRWDTDMKPLVGTAICQDEHVRYVVSGRFRLEMEGGARVDLGPGDLVHIRPGHTGHVVGTEPCVMLDMQAAR